MNWKEMFEKHQLDYSELDKFQEKEGVKLCNEDDFTANENWCKEYELGFNLLPIFTNDESDFVGIYTTGILTGKVACVTHDNIDFSPRFRSLKSFINTIAETQFTFDWQDLPLDSFDYPTKKELSQTKQEEDNKVLTECWNLIARNKFVSDDNYELVAKTIMHLTPYTNLENILCFLDDKNNFVQRKAIWLFGVYYQYLPAKEKIKEIVEKPTFKNGILLNQCYNGELKKQSLWKRIFG